MPTYSVQRFRGNQVGNLFSVINQHVQDMSPGVQYLAKGVDFRVTTSRLPGVELEQSSIWWFVRAAIAGSFNIQISFIAFASDFNNPNGVPLPRDAPRVVLNLHTGMPHYIKPNRVETMFDGQFSHFSVYFQGIELQPGFVTQLGFTLQNWSVLFFRFWNLRFDMVPK
jgi:hypothetical protein